MASRLLMQASGQLHVLLRSRETGIRSQLGRKLGVPEGRSESYGVKVRKYSCLTWESNLGFGRQAV
jgi:hypothetical protein